MLSPTMEKIRGEKQDKILEVVADKGYKQDEDLNQCLENGIIPHVIIEDGKEGYGLEISYEEAEVNTASTKPEELKKSLHAGQFPEAYKEVILNMEIEEVRRKVEEAVEKTEKRRLYMELRKRCRSVRRKDILSEIRKGTWFTARQERF